MFEDITPWYESIIVSLTYTNTSNRTYTCFSEKGDSLYSFKKPNFSYEMREMEAINTEEGIMNDMDDLQQLSRFNLKTQNEKWSTSILQDIPETARLDRKEISKDGDIWTYSFFYTLIDGAKLQEDITFNIETGELIEKK